MDNTWISLLLPSTKYASSEISVVFVPMYMYQYWWV